MRQRSYYPQNQVVSQMTASSNGFLPSRPETPNLNERECAELTNPPVNIREMSMDSQNLLEGNGRLHQISNGYVGDYSSDVVPMDNIALEKSQP